MMSPMMLAAPGFATKKSSILMAVLFFFYPAFIFILLYATGYSFYGTNPLWWAVTIAIFGTLICIICGLPRQFVNVSMGIANYDYFIKDRNVYLKGKRIKGADAKTFTHFNNRGYYSKDKNQVYYNTKKLDSSDASTFQPLASDETSSYWHDKYHAYYKWKRIIGANGASFIYAGYDYAFDQNNVFFQDKLMKEADRATFQSLKMFIGRDAENVFVQNIRSTNIKDITSFQLITLQEETFGKDKDQIYVIRYTPPHPLLPFPDADLETFEVVGEYYAKDKNRVYYYSYHADGILVLKDADPENFTLYFDHIRRTNATDGVHYYKAGVLYKD